MRHGTEVHRGGTDDVSDCSDNDRAPAENGHCLPTSARRRLLWKAINKKDYFPPVLNQPYGVSCTNFHVVIAEGCWPYSRVQLFDIDTGKSLHTSEQGVILPFGVAYTRDDQIAVTDHKDRTVKFLSPDLRSVTSSWPSGIFEWPTGIAVNARGHFYVTDCSKGKVHICDADGENISSFATNVSSDYSRPFFIAVDNHQRIIVSDGFEHVVNVFDESGRLLTKCGNVVGDGKICDPRGVCVDVQENILVADWQASIVRLYSPDGIWIDNVLNENEGISHAWGIAANNIGHLALTEQKLGETQSLKVFA